MPATKPVLAPNAGTARPHPNRPLVNGSAQNWPGSSHRFDLGTNATDVHGRVEIRPHDAE